MSNVYEKTLPEWASWQESEARCQAVAMRLAEIVRTLPDANEKERAALLKEQTALAVEAQTLPATVGELARRYALAHLTWLEGRYQELDAKLSELTPQLEAARARCLAFRKQERELGAENLHNTAKLDAQGQRELQERRAAHDAKALEIGRAWAAEGKQADALEAEHTQTTYRRNAMRDRARLLYGVENLPNHSDWQKSAHFFGEMQRRQADQELHGSWVGPVGMLPQMPRRGALPLA